jgi:hypothetical protein
MMIRPYEVPNRLLTQVTAFDFNPNLVFVFDFLRVLSVSVAKRF